ncbi:MAG: hypothetical protein RLZZ370_628 [Bacteroidota bacterium]|jgi:hypothetical protein
MGSNKYWLLILLAIFTSLPSCFLKNYSLSGVNIPEDVRNISVDFFPNEATLVNPQLSQLFTEKLRSKFVGETRLDLIESQGDFRCSGSIKDYRIDPVAVQNNAAATQNRLQVAIKVKFECPLHPELNFEDVFSFFADYDATANFQSLERGLAEQVCDQIVQQIFNKVALNW